jgi:Protein of unknown function (DUF3014)
MYDDPVSTPSPLPPAVRRSSPRPWVGVVAVARLLLAGILFRWSQHETPAPEQPPPQASAPEPVAPATPAPAAPGVDLPSLNSSDSFVRHQLQDLLFDPQWTAWLEGDDLLRRFAAAIGAIAEGKSPREPLGRLAVKEPFAVRTNADRLWISSSSFARYDRLATMIGRIDIDAAEPIWRLLHPLAEQAWREVAPPGESLNAAVAKALDHLIATPLPTEDIELVLAEGLYRYVDPALESLTPAQKHLLRMGQRNAARVVEVLRACRQLVD